MSLPRLRYFKFPGRCYAARVALFNSLGKDGWIDERLFQGEFRKLKASSLDARRRRITTPETLITNNLPQLILPSGTWNGAVSNSSLTVGQSHAIARWATRLGKNAQFNLYPEHDPEACLVIDEAMALIDAVIGYAPKDSEKHSRLEKRREYVHGDGFLNVGLSHLEHRLANYRAQGPFFLGQELSLADLYLKKPLTDMILDGQFEGCERTYLEDSGFDMIRKHTDEVAKHPLVVEYLKHYKN